MQTTDTDNPLDHFSIPNAMKLISMMNASLLGACMLFQVNGSQAQSIAWTKKSNSANHAINSVAFRADGQKVLSGTNCQPASIRMFDVSSSTMDWDFTVGSPYMCIMGVTFSANSRYIAAIEEFGNVFIFDNTGSVPVIVDTIVAGTANAYSAEISPSSNQIAVGCSNGHLKIYNQPGGLLSADINAHYNMISSIAYSPDGAKIVTGSYDKIVRVWSSNGNLLFSCYGHTASVMGVKVSPDGQYAVSVSLDSKIKVWDLSNGALVRTLSGHTAGIKGVDISPDGRYIVSASQDGTCKIWDFGTGAPVRSLSTAGNIAVNAVAWSPLGNQILTGNHASDLVLWDLPAVLGFGGEVNDVAPTLSPNPAQHAFTLTVPSAAGAWKFNIYNQLGQWQKTCAGTSGENPEISVTDLENGLYYGVLVSGEKTSQVKFVVAR